VRRAAGGPTGAADQFAGADPALAGEIEIFGRSLRGGVEVVQLRRAAGQHPDQLPEAELRAVQSVNGEGALDIAELPPASLQLIHGG